MFIILVYTLYLTHFSPICVLASEIAANPSRGDGCGDDKAGEASATMTKRREDIYELQDGNYYSKVHMKEFEYLSAMCLRGVVFSINRLA